MKIKTMYRCQTCKTVKTSAGACSCNTDQSAAANLAALDQQTRTALATGSQGEAAAYMAAMGAGAGLGVQLAGLGTPGWNEPYCGAWRAPAAEFVVLGPDGMAVCDPTTDAATCTGENPRGLVQKPFELDLEPSADLPVTLFDTATGALQAIYFTRVLDFTTKLTLAPTDVSIGSWSTGRQRQLYTGYGASTKPEQLEKQNPEDIFLPITDFGPSALVDGLNRITGVVARLNLREATKGARWVMRNGKVVKIVVQGYFVINYGVEVQEVVVMEGS